MIVNEKEQEENQPLSITQRKREEKEGTVLLPLSYNERLELGCMMIELAGDV